VFVVHEVAVQLLPADAAMSVQDATAVGPVVTVLQVVPDAQAFVPTVWHSVAIPLLAVMSKGSVVSCATGTHDVTLVQLPVLYAQSVAEPPLAVMS